MANQFWPLFDLVVRTPRIELRPPTDEMFADLLEVATAEMFPDGEVHFLQDWVLQPHNERQRNSMKWWWRQRAEWSVEHWSLSMAVVLEGRAVGIQDLAGDKFPARRSVATGSWLGAPAQGKGLGKEMRQAILHLAFLGLGAKEALSDAFVTNERSRRVSRGVGYEANGRHFDLRAGHIPTEVEGFRMTQERFFEHKRDDIVIENLGPCLEMFGLGPDLEPLVPESAPVPPRPGDP